MRPIDLIAMGLRNLWRRKLRTFLTVLGVIIGTAAIVIMVSLGFGMNEGFKNEISRMGSLNIINVTPPYNYDGGSMGGRSSQPTKLDDKSVSDFAALKGVEAVTPVLNSYLKITSGRYVSYASVKGIDPTSMSLFEFEAAEGRLLQEGDTLNVVFGGYIPQTFYDTRSRGFNSYSNEPKVDVLKDKLEMAFENYDPNGKTPKSYKIKGVGILTEGDYNKDYYVFMSIQQLKKLIDENNKINKNNRSGSGSGVSNSQQGYNEILVKVKEIKDVTRVQNEIKEMGYDAYSLTDFLESMQKTSSMIQAVLGGDWGCISISSSPWNYQYHDNVYL